MAQEIDLLAQVDGGAFVVVEKATNAVWTPEELAAARAAGRYPGEDRLTPADGPLDVNGPFPGCLQQAGAAPTFLGYRAMGQTRHFVVFARPRAGAGVPE